MDIVWVLILWLWTYAMYKAGEHAERKKWENARYYRP